MKCQNCGNSKTNFHYSSNVNGCVTETHLCSECAAKSGYDFERVFNMESVFDDFFPFSTRSAFLPIPFFGFGLESPFGLLPEFGLQTTECKCDGSCEASDQEKPTVEADAEMQKRREINALREQMRLAADNEEFEKAAELRDQIRLMENTGDQ